MDIAAVRLLKRFSMAITDERRKAADDAAALLVSIARAERKVMGPDGKVHVPASHKPSIIAPSPPTATTAQAGTRSHDRGIMAVNSE